MAKSGSHKKCDSKKHQKTHVKQKVNQRIRRDTARWKAIDRTPKHALPPNLERIAKEMGIELLKIPGR
jgi:hypothetical protein